MCSSVFSDFRTNCVNSPVQTKSPAKSETQDKKSKTKDFLKQAAPIALPLAAIPVTALITYKVSTKNMAGLAEQIKNLATEVNTLKANSESVAQSLKKQATKAKNNDTKIWAAIIAAAGLGGSYKAGALSKQDKKDVTETIGHRVDNIDVTSRTALNEAQKAGGGSSTLINKYSHTVNGVKLLDNPSTLNKNNGKYQAAIETIKSAAPKRLYEAPNVKPIQTENPSLWSVTSEFAPIKEGGLGSVPVAIQENVTKLGIDNPAFIPMYQQKGLATFRKEGNDYVYKYGNKMETKLEKAAAFQMDVYRNGVSSTEDVEIYVANLEKDSNKQPRQLIFVKNDNYFDGTIYQGGARNEEPEKFAFFSKAIYEFAKMKTDINSVKNPQIPDKNVFDSIKQPDGFILNDWHASPIAALTRYKAPMENAYGQLNDEATKKLSEMRLITIGHNTMYQGSTQNNNDSKQQKEATSNILNTLFDNYTYDIVSNAESGASKWDKSDKELKNIDNVLLTDKDRADSVHTNLLNMGICLSDYFHPVSKNYAQEIVSDDHADLAGELRWALQRRNEAGSLVGIINGNDFNKLSIEAKEGNIKSTTGIDFKTYNKQTAIDDVIKARNENKVAFYNEFMKPFTQKNDATTNDEQVLKVKDLTNGLEFVEAKDRAKSLPKLTDEEIIDTPIITSVGRLASQKGIDVMCDSIKTIMDNWEENFPDKPKPIFYLAGQDAEKGKQRAFIEKLQDKQLSKEDANRVIFAHGMAPMTAMAAASDFFLLPSNFEPCGLTQSEAFAVATPVIGSSVGGIVDTVNRNGKTNGILTEVEPKLTAKNFSEAMKKAIDVFFNDKEKYKNMVNDSLQEDFSWIQKGKQGPVFDYLKLIGIDTESLPDVA